MNGACLSISLHKNEILFAKQENHRDELTQCMEVHISQLSAVGYEGACVIRGGWLCVTMRVAWIPRCSQQDPRCWSGGQECLLLVGHSAPSTCSHLFSEGQLLACKCSDTKKSLNCCRFSLVSQCASSAPIMSCRCSCNLARLYQLLIPGNGCP